MVWLDGWKYSFLGGGAGGIHRNGGLYPNWAGWQGVASGKLPSPTGSGRSLVPRLPVYLFHPSLPYHKSPPRAPARLGREGKRGGGRLDGCVYVVLCRRSRQTGSDFIKVGKQTSTQCLVVAFDP